MLSLSLQNKDLHINDNGLIVTVDKAAALLQKVHQRLLLFLGEWFLDTTRGVPYFENILGGYNIEVIASIFTHEILKEKAVENVVNTEFSFDSIHRKLTYRCGIISEYSVSNFEFTKAV